MSAAGCVISHTKAEPGSRGGASELSAMTLQPETALDKMSAEFRLVEASHGRYIFKSVDFEIMSERHSVTPGPGISMEDEMGWELAARRRGL